MLAVHIAGYDVRIQINPVFRWLICRPYFFIYFADFERCKFELLNIFSCWIFHKCNLRNWICPADLKWRSFEGDNFTWRLQLHHDSANLHLKMDLESRPGSKTNKSRTASIWLPSSALGKQHRYLLEVDCSTWNINSYIIGCSDLSTCAIFKVNFKN